MALANVMLEGLQNRSQHGKAAAGPGLFAGSWDWHSAVHAHWALLSIARVHGFTDLEKWLINRLSDAALGKEIEFLKKTPGFENPYGRAWLLMVIFELGRRGRASKPLLAMASGLRNDVFGYLSRSTLPEDKASGRFIATHESWLFAYLLVALSEPADDAARDALRRLRKNTLDPARSKIAAVKPTDADFMDLPAALAVIDRVDPIFAGTPAPLPTGGATALHDPPLTNANAHTPGAALVRIWPQAVDSHRGDKNACARFHTRMNEMFSRTDQWADSFELVAHWVPQFMWMSLWLEAGRP